MAEVVRRGLAAALASLSFSAGATPLSEATEAIRASDCAKLGDVVNRYLDGSTAIKYVVGAMYEDGICVERDPARAAKYYAAGDAAKDVDAARDVGLEYVTGVAFPRSYTRAGSWLVKSMTLQRDESGELKLPPGIATLPVEQITPGSEWAGYVVAVGFVASRTQRYPQEALRLMSEGRYVAKVCVADGTVSATATSVAPSAVAGVGRLQGKREILQAIEQNYDRVMKTLPPPKEPAPGPFCFNQPLSFRLR